MLKLTQFFFVTLLLSLQDVRAQAISPFTRNGEGIFTYKSLLLGESLKSLDHLFKTHLEKIEYLLDTYNRPLKNGDVVVIYETELEDGIYFPSYLKINYADNSSESRELIGLIQENTSKRYVVTYYQRTGEKVAMLWVNKQQPGDKKNPGLYDLELYSFKLPLEHPLLEENVGLISALYGERKNPFVGIVEEFHYGTDFKMDVGTLLRSPVNGEIQIGYARRTEATSDKITGDLGYGKFAYINSTYTYRTNGTEGRKRKTIDVAFMLGHLSDFPEELKEQLVKKKLEERNYSNDKYKTFYDWNMKLLSESNEDKILKELRKFQMTTLITGKAAVKMGQEIAFSGETGRATGPHLHYEVIIDGDHVNPLDFYKKFGMKKGMDSASLFPYFLEMDSKVNQYIFPALFGLKK